MLENIKMDKKTLSLSIVGGIGAVISLFCIVTLFLFNGIVQDKIKEELVLKEGSELFQKWSNVELPIYMRFRIFDVQNPDEAEFNGSRPVVRERGPYTFLEKRRKEIIRFEEKGKFVTYKEFKTFHFMPQLSEGSLSDEITVLNIPLVAAIDGIVRESLTSEYGPVLIDVINAIVLELQEAMFEIHTVDEFLFKGYHVPLMERLTTIAREFGMNSKEAPNNNTFGLMVGKNGSDEGIWTVNTGLDSDLFTVYSWQFSRSVPYFNTSECNKIKGSDGSGFPPGSVTRDKPIYIFNTDLCRSAYLVFEKDSSVLGIPTYRFTIPDNFFTAPTKDPENACYCTRPEGERDICDVSGVLDMARCSEGAPIALSPVHFMNTPQELRDSVIGLNPDKEKHSMYLDVEPITGAVVNAARRMQINVRIKPNPEIPAMSANRDTILPILWVEETAAIDGKMGEEFRTNLGKISTGKLVFRVVLFFGFLMIVGALTLHVYRPAPKTGPAS